MENRNILISGASIAGPALAYWLRRHGFNPTVVEQAPEVRPGGYKVDIRGAAVDVAERMGIMADIRKASTNMQGGTFVDSANKPIATMPADFIAGRADRDDEIMRGDLARILYERTRDESDYLFNDAITTIEQTDKGVQVSFEHAAPRSFDLVVGADGLHSGVRALALGDEAQFTRHLGAYVSIFTTPNHLGLDGWELFYGEPGRVANVYSTRRSSEARALFMFASPPLRYDHRDGTQQRRLLADALAGMRWETPRLLEAMADAPDFYFDSISLVEMERWSKGRVALLGDAAYCASPASGQGTSLALVGAYVLAGELAAAGGDHTTAFARYEREMRGYVDVNQKFAANAIKQFLPLTPMQVWLQSQMFRVLPYLPFKRLVIGRIAKQIRHAANAITLKDYQR